MDTEGQCPQGSPSFISKWIVDSNSSLCSSDCNQPEPRVPRPDPLFVLLFSLSPAHLPPPHPFTGCLPMLEHPSSSQGQSEPPMSSSLGTEPGTPAPTQGDLSLHALASVKGTVRSTVCSIQQPQGHSELCTATEASLQGRWGSGEDGQA